ncbi:SpoIIE family protein phosphatase [Streptomyces sp. NPDC002838]|uniref:SpoIIE family protein phosphatase n=1 Tax=Streptomyces sp. NPDC002838 TaxID=3154436 RepID=UPI00331C2CCB
MKGSTQRVGTRPSSLDGIATAVLDARGTVLCWSREAAELLDRTAGEVCGHPVLRLLAEAPEPEWRDQPVGAGVAAGRALLRHRRGDAVEVVFRVLPLEARAEFLVLAAPVGLVSDGEQGAALLRALLAQDRIGIGIHDTDLTVVRTNITPELFGGPALPPGGRLADVMSPQDAEAAEAALRRVLATGVPLVGHEQRMRSPQVPGRQWSFSLSAVRLEDAHGHPMGVAALVTDATAQQRARDYLQLRHEASARIGASLDVTRTAQDLADVLVPALGDLATVDLAEAVLEGDEPMKIPGAGQLHLRRAAVASAAGPWPAALLQVGAAIPRMPDMPVMRHLQRDGAVIIDPTAAAGRYPELLRQFFPEHAHSALAASLFARGLRLGGVVLWRTDRPEAFDEQDADLLAEIASRAALSVDNARRYTREHRAAVALQQRLLPRATTDTPAAQTVGAYRPAGGGAEISGDWFDVIPLPSLRTALVVGDVIGHGLHATATMGRLRTAVQTLADLELGPEELLAHLDDLVARLAAETDPGHRDTVGATCLYAVYDPITRHCTLASAGHPPPVLVRPDGITQLIDISPGPPLGAGGLPFETTTLTLDPDSVLALYTDGLIHRHDPDVGLRHLADRLAAHCRPGRALDEIGSALLFDAPDPAPRDDIALLLARTRALPPDATPAWEFPADPAVVAHAREAATRQLAAWGLDQAAFTTELVVSELVTNAIRYAGGPIGLRLIRDTTVLVCEVTDSSNTQPRLRRARTTDEGGRGLFLVAQLTARWGSRYGPSGKTIWAEQPILPA